MEKRNCAPKGSHELPFSTAAELVGFVVLLREPKLRTLLNV
jgi:hypothetical protein